MREGRNAIGWLLLLAALALYGATINDEITAPDERQRLALAEAIAANGLGALEDSGTVSRYPPLTSIVAAPFVGAARALGSHKPLVWGRRGAAVSSVVVCALIVLVLFQTMRRLGYDPLASTLVGAAFVLANPLWPYSKRLYSEPLSALLVTAVALGLAELGRRPRLGVSLIVGSLGLLMLSAPAPAAVTGLAALAALTLARRWRALAWSIAGLALCLAGVVAMQFLRFGKLASGYEGEKFTFEMATGLYGLVLSPGRSVFLYAPLVLLGVPGALLAWRRGQRMLPAFAMLALVGQVTLMAAWWSWHGGDCYGPRLTLAVLPAAGLLAVELARLRWARWLLVPITALGLYAQLLGVAFVHEYDSYLWPDAERTATDRYDWEWAQLRRLPRDVDRARYEMSSLLLQRDDHDATVIRGDGRPVDAVEVTQGGESIVHKWAIADVRVFARGRRVPTREAGLTLEPMPPLAGGGGLSAATDDDIRSGWFVGTRRDGLAVRVRLGARVRALDRLELVHWPYRDDFPSHVTAVAVGPNGARRPLEVVQGAPDLHMPLSFWLLVALGLGALAGAIALGVRDARERRSRRAAPAQGASSTDSSERSAV